jgi:hypothetical protein
MAVSISVVLPYRAAILKEIQRKKPLKTSKMQSWDASRL